MLQNPRVTVVVPTRERGDVLPFTLTTLCRQDYTNLDILVCDNFSSDNTREVVNAYGDKRVRYVNSGRRLAMSSNWDFAMSHVHDTDLVAFVGDDDGMVDGAIARGVELLRQTGAEALRAVPCDYHWPKRNGQAYGKLVVNGRVSTELRYGRQWLQKVVFGGFGYTQLPVIYNGGLVPFQAISRLKHSGRWFHSPIPDVYSGIALASVIERYAYTTETLFLNGASHHSIGTSFFAPKSTDTQNGAADPSQLFLSEGNLPYHASLPPLENGGYPRSTRLMIFDAYLQSQSLRNGEPTLDPTRVLTEVLAAASPNDIEDIREWGKRYARANGLSLESAARSGNWLRRQRWLVSRFRNLARKQKRVVFNSGDTPLVNVADAAAFANGFSSRVPAA